MSSLKRNLRIVFDETTAPIGRAGTNRRYKALALEHGPGWGVYDCDADRFLKDGEVAALSLLDLRTPMKDGLS